MKRHWREDLETTTIAGYEQHVRLHIVPLCGGVKLTSLTIPIAENLRDELLDKLSRPMAIRVLQSLTAIVQEAKRKGHVSQNVFDDVSIKRSTRTPDVVIPLKGELRMILRLASMSSDPMALPLVMLLYFAGLRASELRGLCWRHFDARRGTITIDQRADSNNVIGPPKSKSGFRTIPLPPSAIEVLKRWRSQCPSSFLNLVFPSVGSRVMSHNYLTNNVLKPILLAAGVFDEVYKKGTVERSIRYTLHDFRHAAAALWIEQRVSPKRIQYWMGHSSIQVTFDTYGHLFEQAEQDAAIATAVESDLTRHFEAAWLQGA
ncbi:tyrosine-type recombinase/integrase [Sphingomonas turrisvirgatae]|nr:site-specific integrase [Sphingomonas turrisvirgatae]